MKKFFVAIACFLSCAVFCCCTSKVTDKQVASDENLNKLGNMGGSGNQTIEDYDIYGLKQSDPVFNLAIANNGIDTAYRNEIDLASTNEELVQIELKYISIWEAELDSSIKKYIAVLSEEDQLAFQTSQELFDRYSEVSISYDANLLLQGKYGINLGTSSRWLLNVNKKEIIRERTIHVKYLHYLLEQAEGVQEDYSSLVFEAV